MSPPWISPAASANTPGLNLPTYKAMIGPTPRDSAIIAQNDANTKLNDLTKIGGRKTHRRNKNRRGGAVVIPQMQTLYTPQGGPGQNPNDIIKQNSHTSTQGTANAVYDKYANQMGGYIYGKMSRTTLRKKSISNNKSNTKRKKTIRGGRKRVGRRKTHKKRYF